MGRPRAFRIAFAALLVGLALLAVPFWRAYSGLERAADGVFLVKPYLQWGPGRPAGSRSGMRLDVLWQGVDRDERWSVQVGAVGADGVVGHWDPVDPPSWQRAALEGIAPRRLYRATFPERASGSPFAYRHRLDGVTVFEARARAPRTEAQPHRFVVFGDGGAGTSGQRAVAYQAFQARPDFVMITGDLVYFKGRFSEYLRKFFPIYNSDRASPSWGAPLLRSTMVLATPGNHDLIERDLDRCPDGLAYYLLWSLPLNGPIGTPGAPNTAVLRGEAGRQRALRELAGTAYPRMANYSFDYGGAHWTVLDSNTYVDWTDPDLRDWLERDLASDAARDATWRFVAFHHPPFHSSRTHADEQRTRVLAGLFERARVDLVFCGHIHNYQRTHPLRFVASGAANGTNTGRGLVDAAGHVDGRWTLDTAYDGISRTRPDGIIYVTSGAGGAPLYDRSQQGRPASWHDFTARFIADTHSLTVVDVTDSRLTLRQVSASGEELDRFDVTKDGPSNMRVDAVAVATPLP
jgi:3',5'-cyclic AMP phosphodiesterase CpdA